MMSVYLTNPSMKKPIHIGALSLQLAFTRMATFAWMLFALLGFSAPSLAETVRLYFDPASPQIAFAAGDIKAALESQGHIVQTNNLSALTNDNLGRKIILATTNNTSVISNLLAQGGSSFGNLGEQAYALRTTTNSHLNYWVVGGAAVGAMYGGLQLAENITFDGISGTYAEQVSPDFAQRGVKLNLPLDRRIPTYSGFTANTSTQYAVSNVWDITFWETWLDQQARNRYNVLSVWVHHPFPALVRVPEYSNACLPSIEGFFGYSDPSLTHEQRVAFWRQVMTYAHNRGFSFYFFCWNVCAEYAEDMYPGIITESESNTNTLDYLSKSMKALLETYPELDGFGISAGAVPPPPAGRQGPARS